MNSDMPVDSVFARVRKGAKALARVVGLPFGERKRIVNDVEKSIEEFKRLSGTGHSNEWRFDRDEIHRRR